MALGLMRSGVYENGYDLVRRGGFQLLSALTTTGFGTIPGRYFVTDWGTLAPAMIVGVMALGGMASSTTGGIKALRVGLILKAIASDLHRLLLPSNAVVVTSYQVPGRREILRQPVVRTAMLITLLFITLFLAGAMVALFYGYTLEEAIFESISATSPVGLSIGMVGPDLELGLKVIYIFSMWIGRLEFISVFAFFGFVYAMYRGKL